MKTKTACTAALILGLSLIHLPRAFGQGSLTPPPGPPAPTMKSLDQIEARTILNVTNAPGDAANTFIISAPGSYYFTGNITGDPGKHGISIQANDVTLDLNGFALISGGGALIGVAVPVAQSAFCIRNGSVRGWTGGGVQAANTATLAEKLRLSENVGATGLSVGNGSIITDCVASGNGAGFYAADRTQISNCISTVNTGVGFSCGSYVNIVDCSASRNGYHGIVVAGSSSVIRCNSSRNIPLGGSPGGSGIVPGSGCTISDCTAGSNEVNGIGTFFETSDCTIQNCSAQANGQAGIQVKKSCHVLGNTCNGNLVGITAGSSGNRIDGNSCNDNTSQGFSITGANLIIRNSARGNPTAYSIGPVSPAGPVVDMTAGGTITSTSPWANFSY